MLYLERQHSRLSAIGHCFCKIHFASRRHFHFNEILHSPLQSLMSSLTFVTLPPSRSLSYLFPTFFSTSFPSFRARHAHYASVPPHTCGPAGRSQLQGGRRSHVPQMGKSMSVCVCVCVCEVCLSTCPNMFLIVLQDIPCIPNKKDISSNSDPIPHETTSVRRLDM